MCFNLVYNPPVRNTAQKYNTAGQDRVPVLLLFLPLSTARELSYSKDFIYHVFLLASPREGSEVFLVVQFHCFSAAPHE